LNILDISPLSDVGLVKIFSHSFACHFVDQPLLRLTRGHRDNLQINKVRNENGDITTETEEIKKKIHQILYYKSLYPVKLENLDEIDNFLDRYQVSKLNQD